MSGENTLLETELTFASARRPSQKGNKSYKHPFSGGILGCPRNFSQWLGSVGYNPNIYPIYISRVK